MPYTRAQLTSIMRTRGQAHVPADKLPYAGRVAEMYTRKKLYRWEDKAALAQHTLLKNAYQDIQSDAMNRAGFYELDTLSNDGYSTAWRREVLQNTAERLNTLAIDTARLALNYREQAYRMGYYARLWLLDSITSQDKQPRGGRVQAPAVNAEDWLERYQTPVDKTLIKTRAGLSAALAQEMTVRQAVTSAIAEPLGVSSKPGKKTGGLYHLQQVTTRETVMQASNEGAAEVYKQNSDWLTAIMYLTARDGRVCAECQRMDGFIWPIDGFITAVIGLLGMPPLHTGCRCTIIPLLLPGLGYGDEPPDDTFDDWLFDGGLGGELDPFFMDGYLENTQV